MNFITIILAVTLLFLGLVEMALYLDGSGTLHLFWGSAYLVGTVLVCWSAYQGYPWVWLEKFRWYKRWIDKRAEKEKLRLRVEGDTLMVRDGYHITKVALDRISTISAVLNVNLAYDTVCLVMLESGVRILTIPEYSIGFQELVEELQRRYKGIPPDWYLQIIANPANKNHLKLWERADGENY